LGGQNSTLANAVAKSPQIDVIVVDRAEKLLWRTESPRPYSDCFEERIVGLLVGRNKAAKVEK
jgi:hypothetical protein